MKDFNERLIETMTNACLILIVVLCGLAITQAFVFLATDFWKCG